MRVNRIAATLLAAAALLCAGAARGQDAKSARDRDLFVGLDVGYNTAFRDRSWAPVTVEIVNEQRDFDGYIEVRTFDFSNQQQSPSYILPAQCPKDSRKRFTLYAYLSGVERVEAWLYERGRRALDVPAYMQVQPIGKDDLLLLVLDDDPFNYGFLYAAVQREGKVVRVSRHGLPTSDLERMPDIPQAYEAFDAIVLGDIDPDRIAQRHRALIENYVAQGGTLVVSTGANAADYRGSWVAPLMGAQIGEATLTTEGDLARALPDAARAGLRPERQAMLASLSPGDGATAAGDGVSLAVQRPLGTGRVYTVALDATSHALQDTAGYQALWRDMLTRRPDATATLNYEGFSNAIVQALPNLSGVTIRPLGWVMTYLLLYLAVGVVANWLFWNALKRREMAWLCLVGFSLAFTAYAMLFGRSGNLREAQQHTVGVVEMGPDGARAKVHALTGILTARTRTYSGTIEGARPIVRDAAGRSTAINVFTGMPGGGSLDSRPFGWVQSDPARIQSFRVGASELRMVVLENERPVDGGFAGELQIDESGIRGELENATGFPLRDASLVFDGVFIPMTIREDRLLVSIGTAELHQRRSEDSNTAAQLQYVQYSWGQAPELVWGAVKAALFADDSFQFNFDLPPYVVAWSDEPPGIGFVPDAAMTETSTRTLVVSPVPVNDRRNKGSDVPLLVSFGGEWFRSRNAPPVRFGQVATASLSGSIRVRLPQDAREGEGDVIVELYWGIERGERRAVLVPNSGASSATPEDVAWHEARFEGDERVDHGNVQTRSTYRIEDWADHLAPEGRVVEFGVTFARVGEETSEERKFREAGIQTWGEYSATARWVPRATVTASTGEWPQWR